MPLPGLWNPEWTSHGPFIEKIKDRLAASHVPGRGRRPVCRRQRWPGTITFIAATPLGHPLAPILAHWLDNHMFVASTLIGFTVMQRYPTMKVVVAHGKASWMQEVLEKMEASTRVIPLLHHYPVRTEAEEMWEHGHVMLGFDAEERLIQQAAAANSPPRSSGARAIRTTIPPAPGMPSRCSRRPTSPEATDRPHAGWERRRTVWHCAGPDGSSTYAIQAPDAHMEEDDPGAEPRGTQAPGKFSGRSSVAER